VPRQKSAHVDDPKAVGKRLRDARVRAGISQRQLAFQGCSPGYISRIEAGDRIASLQILRELGRRLGVSEDYLATGTERRVLEADAQLAEAEAALLLDETETARRLYAAALDDAVGRPERARALAGLGKLAFRCGNPHEAIARLEEALELSSSLATEDPAVPDSLGRAYATTGDVPASVDLFQRCLAAAEERGDQMESVRFAVLLGHALIDRGDFSHAGEVLGRALELTRGSHDPVVRARLYWLQSRFYAEQEQPLAAARYARKTLALVELTEHALYAARAHQLLAYIEIDRGRGEEALEILEAGWPLLAEASPLEQAQYRLEEARALALVGKLDEAATLAMTVSGQLAGASPEDAGRAYVVLARIFAQLDDRRRARELYELAIELLRMNPNRFLAEAYNGLADLAEAEGDADAASLFRGKAAS
jgi:tetratricopeptide (TPR) repeat protein